MDSLQKRNLFFMMMGRIVALTGAGIQMLAMPLYILDRTGSGTMMGVFTLISSIPLILFSPLAGVLGDRWNRKLIAVYTDCGRSIVLFGLGLLAFKGILSIPVLCVCSVMISLMDSLFNAATTAMLPDLVSESEFGKANATKGIVDGLSMMIGPVLGGVIYGAAGITAVFFLNAGTMLVSALSEVLIVYPFQSKNQTRLSVGSVYLEFQEILSYVVKYKALAQLFLYGVISSFLLGPMITVALPFILKKTIGFSSQQYGYIMAGFMIGILIGNLLLGFVFSKFNTGRMMKTGFSIYGFIFCILTSFSLKAIISYFGGPSWSLFFTIGASFVTAGFFYAFVNTPMMTNFQKMVPSNMRARFFATQYLLFQLGTPLGSVIFGFSLDAFPPHIAFMSVGVLFLVYTVFFLISSSPQVFQPEPAE